MKELIAVCIASLLVGTILGVLILQFAREYKGATVELCEARLDTFEAQIELMEMQVNDKLKSLWERERKLSIEDGAMRYDIRLLKRGWVWDHDKELEVPTPNFDFSHNHGHHGPGLR